MAESIAAQSAELAANIIAILLTTPEYFTAELKLNMQPSL